MIMAKEDVDQRITFSKSLITKFPNITLHSKLRDAHLYIFKHWVLDLIVERKSISSIKEDLLPLLVKAQSSNTPIKEFQEKSIKTQF
jgi:translation initiation factor eIF-2B subunit gamma